MASSFVMNFHSNKIILACKLFFFKFFSKNSVFVEFITKIGFNGVFMVFNSLKVLDN